MQLRIADKSIGQIVIDSNRKINKVSEYAIKSLCMLQLMCLNCDENDPKFGEFISILRDATLKMDALYNSKGKDNVDPFEQFNASKL